MDSKLKVELVGFLVVLLQCGQLLFSQWRENKSREFREHNLRELREIKQTTRVIANGKSPHHRFEDPPPGVDSFSAFEQQMELDKANEPANDQGDPPRSDDPWKEQQNDSR